MRSMADRRAAEQGLTGCRLCLAVPVTVAAGIHACRRAGLPSPAGENLTQGQPHRKFSPAIRHPAFFPGGGARQQGWSPLLRGASSHTPSCRSGSMRTPAVSSLRARRGVFMRPPPTAATGFTAESPATPSATDVRRRERSSASRTAVRCRCRKVFRCSDCGRSAGSCCWKLPAGCDGRA